MSWQNESLFQKVFSYVCKFSGQHECWSVDYLKLYGAGCKKMANYYLRILRKKFQLNTSFIVLDLHFVICSP